MSETRDMLTDSVLDAYCSSTALLSLQIRRIGYGKMMPLNFRLKYEDVFSTDVFVDERTLLFVSTTPLYVMLHSL